MPLEEQDLSQIKELIDKNNENLISSKLPELIKSSNEGLQTRLATQISGATKRMFDTIDEIKTSIPKTESIVDAVKASFSPSNDSNPANNNSNSKNDNNSSLPDQDNNKYQELIQKMENQANAIKSLTSSVDQERKLREQAEHVATQEKIYGSFISSVSDKVVDPRNFLRTLIDAKKVEEKDGALVVPIPGKIDYNGEQVYEPAVKHVDDFLKNDYSYFAKARQGNGSGSSPGEPYQQQTPPQFFTEEINPETGKLDASYLVQAFSEGKEEEIFNEAKNL